METDTVKNKCSPTHVTTPTEQPTKRANKYQLAKWNQHETTYDQMQVPMLMTELNGET